MIIYIMTFDIACHENVRMVLFNLYCAETRRKLRGNYERCEPLIDNRKHVWQYVGRMCWVCRDAGVDMLSITSALNMRLIKKIACSAAEIAQYQIAM